MPIPLTGPREGCLYLTFDDGPHPEWTPRVLAALAGAGARATFFVVGELARAYPALLRRMVDEGHAIGNHTWSHRHPWKLTTSAARREVTQGAAVIADITGSRCAHFRPPYGRVRRCMVEAAQAEGQALVLWSLSAQDWGWLGHADRIAARLDRARADQIILMHDGPMRSNRPHALLHVLPAFLRTVTARWECRPLITGGPTR